MNDPQANVKRTLLDMIQSGNWIKFEKHEDIVEKKISMLVSIVERVYVGYSHLLPTDLVEDMDVVIKFCKE